MTALRVIVGTDEVGSAYRDAIVHELELSESVEAVLDIGTHPTESGIATMAAEMIAIGEADRAILIGETGIDLAISANKVAGIRAARAHDSFSVERSILSNNVQVLCLGQRVIGEDVARGLAREWVTYSFDSTSPSAEKLDVLADYESTGSC